MILGFVAAAAICVVDFFGVPVITSPLCMIMNETFETLDLNHTWSRIVDMSGFQYVHPKTLMFLLACSFFYHLFQKWRIRNDDGFR